MQSRCPCRGMLGTLKTPSCPWRWVPGSRSKFGNWTSVPSLYSWNIAEFDVKPQSTTTTTMQYPYVRMTAGRTKIVPRIATTDKTEHWILVHFVSIIVKKKSNKSSIWTPKSTHKRNTRSSSNSFLSIASPLCRLHWLPPLGRANRPRNTSVKHRQLSHVYFKPNLFFAFHLLRMCSSFENLILYARKKWRKIIRKHCVNNFYCLAKKIILQKCISPTGDRSIPKICTSGEMLSHPMVSHPRVRQHFCTVI